MPSPSSKSTVQGSKSIRSKSTPVWYRYAEVRDEDWDGATNTLQVAFSSEHPVKRKANKWDVENGVAARVGDEYLEVLSHERADADLSQLNNDGAFLDEHNPEKHLGKVSRAEISDDRKGRAVLEFDGETELSRTRYKQARKRSRPHISFGYTRSKFLGDGEAIDGVPAKRFAWAGDEISSVAIPADPTVGSRRGSKTRGDLVHCTKCGVAYDRDDLDEDYRCEDCGPVERSKPRDFMFTFTPVGADGVRAKKSEQVSFGNLTTLVQNAAKEHEDFKNGYAYVSDIMHDDGDWEAIVTHNGKHHAIGFKLGPGQVELEDESYEVVYQGNWETVGEQDGRSAELTADGRLVRSDGSEPYGDVAYADPGYQSDGKKRYPIDTKEHAKAAWSYINQAGNADKYTPTQLAHIKSKIKAACKHFGVEISDDRGAPAVDSENLTEEERTILRKNMSTAAATPPAVDEASVRARLEPEIRGRVEGEFKAKSDKRAAFVKEVRALADQYDKDHGVKWIGPRGSVLVVAGQIRKFENEAMDEADSTNSDQALELVKTNFKAKCNDMIRGARAPLPQTEAANLPNELASRVKLGDVFRAAAKDIHNRSTCWMPKDGAAFEADQEIRTRKLDFPMEAGLKFDGLQIPMNAPSMVRMDTPFGRAIRNSRGLAGDRFTRDAFAGDFTTAGALIAPDYVFPYIELLRNYPALARAGMTILGGVMGPVVLPRQTGATTASFVAEGDQLAQFDQALDQIRLTPHRLGTSQNYSRLALLESTPDFEAMVMNDHMAVMALKIDYGLLNGQGGNNEPLGVLNQIIPTVAFAGSAANAFKNAVLMQTNVRKTNIMEPGAYISTSVGRGSLMSTAKLLTGATTVVANPVWTDDEKVAGHAAWDSQQVPNDIIVYGIWRHLVMAQWGGLAVILDTLTRARNDEYVLTTNTYIDGALRHNTAVCRSVDSVGSLS